MLSFNMNSWTAKLYRWVYRVNRMPNNLCPYFWKVVIMYTLLIPYVLLIIPLIILEKIMDERHDRLGDDAAMGGRMAIGFILYLMIGISISPVMLILYPHQSLFLAGTIVFGLIAGVALIAYVQDRSERYGTKTYIAVEYVKSIYDKICPIITWKRK